MIEQIKGNLVQKTPTFCVLDLNGFGIGINISLNTFQSLKNYGENSEVSLFTHLHVREDLLQLYGFSDVNEKDLFRLLISVSGIGPRLAITLLSGPSSEEIQNAIVTENITYLTKVPGVGKKTAQRLILELKEKVTEKHGVTAAEAAAPISGPLHPLFREAMLAMVQLGYKQQEAVRALNKAVQKMPENGSLEELIKLALREL
ncbi:MAG: Holliday junction branch migration protein RuvA [Calditrichia bacterium]